MEKGRTVQVKFLKSDQLVGIEHSLPMCVIVIAESHSPFLSKLFHRALNFPQCLLRGHPSRTREQGRVVGGEEGQGDGICGRLPTYQPKQLCFDQWPLLMALFKQRTPWLNQVHCDKGCG